MPDEEALLALRNLRQGALVPAELVARIGGPLADHYLSLLQRHGRRTERLNTLEAELEAAGRRERELAAALRVAKLRLRGHAAMLEATCGSRASASRDRQVP